MYDNKKNVKNDGVVKSPIYCGVVFFQTLGILHVWLRSWKNTTPCIWTFLLSHL